MASPIRRLEGITYWVIDEPTDIYDFVNRQLRLEWIGDARDEGREPEEDVWLKDLSKRKWQLEILGLELINPNPYEFIPRTGYNFEERLTQRVMQLHRAIEKYGSVIWPVTVRGEDLQLVDGFCGFTTLKEMGITKLYAYVGRF